MIQPGIIAHLRNDAAELFGHVIGIVRLVHQKAHKLLDGAECSEVVDQTAFSVRRVIFTILLDCSIEVITHEELANGALERRTTLDVISKACEIILLVRRVVGHDADPFCE